ncbi:hypothetical protein [Bacillus sp. T33-2]|uniref:hypothetical protein n=1 Tax=Bacillus sp. T33-2 TaxID=2054168 RepID=UPI000C7879AD|nr:hypothetical protein [Bacillus sp. T33-2]PLR93223.1 hypothetical protein CVD19_19665 [Bacillus sp. T33-2]
MQIQLIKVFSSADAVDEQQEEKIYTESQWKATEKYYLARLNKEREEKERAQELARALQGQLANKIKELDKLDFFVTALSNTLLLTTEYHRTGKAQQNG